MSVTLTPQLEDRIQQWILTGRYPDAEAVIDNALQALEKQQHERFLQTRALIHAGLNSDGDVELTPEVWAEIEREADEADRLNLPIRDAVRP